MADFDPKKLLERARDGKFAVGAFNVDNFEIFKAVRAAAVAQKSPVLVELSAGEVATMGIGNMAALVTEARRDGVEMYLNLDHSPEVSAAKEAISAGFDFIHYDGWQNEGMTKEENIKNLKELAPLVYAKGKILEGEEQYFQGSSTVHEEAISEQLVKQSYTDPDEARKFVEETGVDIFAVSVGNLHGLYASLKNLNIDLMKKIRKILPDTYFSLHGGSGTKLEDYQKVIELGVVKININSEMREAFREALVQELRDNPKEYKSYKYLDDVSAVVQKVVEDKMKIFGSAGKARG